MPPFVREWSNILNSCDPKCDGNGPEMVVRITKWNNNRNFMCSSGSCIQIYLSVINKKRNEAAAVSIFNWIRISIGLLNPSGIEIFPVLKYRKTTIINIIIINHLRLHKKTKYTNTRKNTMKMRKNQTQIKWQEWDIKAAIKLSKWDQEMYWLKIYDNSQYQ